MKRYITASITRQAKTVHTNLACPHLQRAGGIVPIDEAENRVTKQCQWCKSRK